MGFIWDRSDRIDSKFTTSDKIYHLFGGVSLFLVFRFWLLLPAGQSFLLVVFSGAIVEVSDAYLAWRAREFNENWDSKGGSLYDFLATFIGGGVAWFVTFLDVGSRWTVLMLLLLSFLVGCIGNFFMKRLSNRW